LCSRARLVIEDYGRNRGTLTPTPQVVKALHG